MSSSIHVITDADHALYFVIRDGGAELARSQSMRTICRIEDALGQLHEMARYGGDECASRPMKRKCLRLLGTADPTKVAAALRAVIDANVVDERPVGRRRTDVGGSLGRFTSRR